MASGVVLRQSLVATKRPLVPLQQLGASFFFLYTPSDLNSPTARRSTTNFAYVPGGRTSLPPLPSTHSLYFCRIAIYKGTVNDPTTFPSPSKSHGSYHWSFERLLAAGLVPLTTAAFVTSGSPAPLIDGLLGVSLIVHSHIGVRLFVLSPLGLILNVRKFDAVLVDYVHKRKFPKLGPLLTWTLRATTLAVGVGVYQFNTNDIGASETCAPNPPYD